MKISEYQKLAATTMQCDMTQDELFANILCGLIGELGELLDYIKKQKYHRHGRMDINVLIEEFGDALWYYAALAECLGIDLNEVAENNISKLQARYPEGFSFEASKARIDKTGKE